MRETREINMLEVFFGDHPKYELVSKVFDDRSRWFINWEVVGKDREDSTLWAGRVSMTTNENGYPGYDTVGVQVFRWEEVKVIVSYKKSPQPGRMQGVASKCNRCAGPASTPKEPESAAPESDPKQLPLPFEQ